MHKALFLLLKLRMRGTARRLGAGLKKPKGILLALFGATLVSLWMGPFMLRAFFSEKQPIERFEKYIPAAIALLVLVNLISRAAKPGGQFTRSDVDLLFAAPFSRRDLLLYKCAEMLAAAVAVSLLFSLFFSGFDVPWIATFIAFVFIVQFVNLLSMAASMAGDPLRRMMRGLLSKAVVVAVVALIAIVASMQVRIEPEAGFMTNLDAALEAPIVQIMLLPVQPFANLLAVSSIVAFVLYALVCIALMGLTFALIVRLDAQTIDATVARSQEYQKQLQQAKKHAGLAGRVSARAARRRIAQLPWLGGTGPILWKQLTTALRTISSVMIPIGIMVGIFGAMLLFSRTEDGRVLGPFTIIIVVMLSVSLPQMLFYDFRRDLDQMDWLKGLPIRPLPLAIGQVLTPVIVTTLLQWLLLALAALAGAASPGLALSIAAIVFPFNLLNVAIENAGFLLYPTRQLAAGLADFIAFSRMMLLFMVKFIVLAACTGAAALIGWIAMMVGGSWIAFAAGLTLGLTIAAAASLPIVAGAFAKFDVSRDLPA